MKNKSFDLNLKKPVGEYEVKDKYFSLRPEQYADFIEAGMKLLPDKKAVIKKRNKNLPKIKFKL